MYLADGDPPQGRRDASSQPDLARTLQLLADKGFDGFYRGDVATKLRGVACTPKAAHWTPAELAGYRVRERAPLRFSYRDWRITTAPPPSSGGIALAEILQIADGWDLRKLDRAHRVHFLVEAMRRAFRDRTIYLGDPDFVRMPLARLMSPDYAAGLRASIHPDKATPSDAAARAAGAAGRRRDHAFLDHRSRRQPRVGDADGEPVVRLRPRRARHRRAAQRRDGRLRAQAGHAQCVRRHGLRRQCAEAGQAHAQFDVADLHGSRDKVIARSARPAAAASSPRCSLGILGYDDGLNAQQVAALPRFHHQWWPDVISAEAGALDPATVKALQAMGHTVNAGEPTWGNLQTVEWDRRSNTLSGGSDPRNPVGKADVLLQK